MPLNYFEGLACATVEAALRDLDPNQKEQLEKLRAIFDAAWSSTEQFPREVKPDIFTLLRCLRADKWKPEAAWKRLRTTLQWRADLNVDKLLEDPPASVEVHDALRVRRILGCGKQGQVVVFERMGELLGTENFRGLPMDEWILNHVVFMENLAIQFRKASEQQGKPMARMAYIADASGIQFGPATRGLPYIQGVTDVADAHCPDILDAVYLVNVPRMATYLWGFAKRFLNPDVSEKVHFFSDVPTDVFRELIDPALLPAEMGGQADPIPHTVIWHPDTGPFVGAEPPDPDDPPGRRPRFLSAKETEDPSFTQQIVDTTADHFVIPLLQNWVGFTPQQVRGFVAWATPPVPEGGAAAGTAEVFVDMDQPVPEPEANSGIRRRRRFVTAGGDPEETPALQEPDDGMEPWMHGVWILFSPFVVLLQLVQGLLQLFFVMMSVATFEGATPYHASVAKDGRKG
eukprot:CAMPEP_0204349068 /NCGR_PEP_ID=MMETSP0469-20131031/29214_1 /ASSEMBLY_ACC=CAM_ASM_000384 /TAXON_ID=2969 /ORGANISM="Oxyrrhis marina" /LENGTH=458 /DNA_ID=CAMNT_0051335175 /DNA_START=35 /DNA_END=1411 /DNA_ORIENTATION=-